MDQGVGLLGPEVNLSGIGAAIAVTEEGDLEFHDLTVEGSSGGAGELFEGGDAGVEEDAAVVAADAGDSGEVTEGDPFLDMLNVDARSGTEVFFARGGPGLAQQVKGGLDSEGMEGGAIGFGESGEMFEGPVGRFEGRHGRRSVNEGQGLVSRFSLSCFLFSVSRVQVR